LIASAETEAHFPKLQDLNLSLTVISLPWCPITLAFSNPRAIPLFHKHAVRYMVCLLDEWLPVLQVAGFHSHLQTIKLGTEGICFGAGKKMKVKEK
jgi:hypothetical protein